MEYNAQHILISFIIAVCFFDGVGEILGNLEIGGKLNLNAETREIF
jgi:hypothetical protein